MNIFTTYGVYIIAAAQIVFGVVGLLSGWITTAEALTILSLGLSTFGIHKSNVAAAGVR